MKDLKMYTQEEVCDMLNIHVQTLVMYREIGIIKPIKTGKNYMFSRNSIERFQKDYEGLDVSNRVKAIESYERVNNTN